VDLQEYENMSSKALPSKLNCKLEEYSGANRELSVIFSQLTLLKGITAELNDSLDVEKLISQFPKKAIFDLFDQTASIV
jgi:hypothetical protein